LDPGEAGETRKVLSPHDVTVESKCVTKVKVEEDTKVKDTHNEVKEELKTRVVRAKRTSNKTVIATPSKYVVLPRYTIGSNRF